MPKGTLYLVATPIGNLNELTPRAIEVLKMADIIACEDTRNSVKLLSHFDIHTRLTAYHNFNEETASKELVEQLLGGENIALISDAGYPLISDPGFELRDRVIENGIRIVPVSGANAGLDALVASGLDTKHYLFYGFLNAKPAQARKELEEIRSFPYTLIFYEAPHRIGKTLKLMREVLGNRKACVCRELTKIHEEFIRGTLDELSKLEEVRGEIVVVVEGCQKKEEVPLDMEQLKKEVDELVSEGRKVKDAVVSVSLKYDVSKNDLYNYYHQK